MWPIEAVERMAGVLATTIDTALHTDISRADRRWLKRIMSKLGEEFDIVDDPDDEIAGPAPMPLHIQEQYNRTLDRLAERDEKFIAKLEATKPAETVNQVVMPKEAAERGGRKRQADCPPTCSHCRGRSRRRWRQGC